MALASSPTAALLSAFASHFRPYFIAAGAFSLVLNILLLVPALFMLQVFDRVLTSRSIETLLMLLLLAVGALIFMAFLDVIRTRLLAAAGVALERMLGPQVFAGMIRRGASAAGAGDAIHGLRDVNALRTFLTGPGILALFDAPWVPAYVLLVFLFHPLLGAVALAGAAIMFMLAILNEALSRRPLEAMQLESRRIGRYAEQGMANAEVARALGMVDGLTSGWSRLSRGGLEKQIEAGQVGSVLTGLTRFVRQLLQVAMLAMGSWLVIEQHASPGVMIAATILLSRALAPVEYAIAGWKALVDARSAYRRLERMLGEEPAEEAVTELPAPRGALSVERVVFGYRGQDRPVIKQVSFQLAAGQALAVIGPSASGKSTLVRLIVGLWRPNLGVVRLDGADVAAIPRSRLGPYIGYLPQSVELFGGTVSENVARMGNIDSELVVEAAKRAHAHEMILRLPQGYDTPIGEAGAVLSAGQRQRVALARALYGEPRLVVLDEPNSNLDAEGEAALLEAIRRLKAQGVTVVIVTHRGAILAAMDRVLVLRDGIAEKFCPPAELRAVLQPLPAERAGAVVGQIHPNG
jgi:PrtD family type I secretion system ABC transporter